MEDPQQRKAVIALIRQAMPRVAQMVAERRRELGDEYVTLCQVKGMAGEPGWFYAREGALAVGTPWAAARDSEMIYEAAGTFAGKAFVVLRPKETTHAA